MCFSLFLLFLILFERVFIWRLSELYCAVEVCACAAHISYISRAFENQKVKRLRECMKWMQHITLYASVCIWNSLMCECVCVFNWLFIFNVWWFAWRRQRIHAQWFSLQNRSRIFNVNFTAGVVFFPLLRFVLHFGFAERDLKQKWIIAPFSLMPELNNQI